MTFRRWNEWTRSSKKNRSPLYYGTQGNVIFDLSSANIRSPVGDRGCFLCLLGLRSGTTRHDKDPPRTDPSPRPSRRRRNQKGP